MSLFQKYRKWWIALGVLLALWIMMRGCNKGYKGRHVYVIARDATWYPSQLMGREKNLLGFSDDLLIAVARESDLRFDLIDTGPHSLIEGVDNGSFDAAFSFITADVMTEERYAFSDLILELGPVVVMRVDAPVMTLKDMEGKTIGVQASSLRAYGAITRSIDPLLHYIVVPYNSVLMALDALKANLIDAVIVDAIPAYTYIEGLYSGQLKVVSAPLGDEGLRLMGRKGTQTTELLTKFDEAMAVLRKNGTFDALVMKWGLIDPVKRYLIESTPPHEMANF